ncbi:hypothetical protein evm_004972 [Chilo suppressalis]|nr:hypothetical protein evm_004972 [Chilo suppressalis]
MEAYIAQMKFGGELLIYTMPDQHQSGRGLRANITQLAGRSSPLAFLHMFTLLFFCQDDECLKVLVHGLTDTCWDTCMGRPSMRLDSKTEVCIMNCVERFIDATTFITKRLMNTTKYSIRNFLHRHRRKFFVTGAVVGGLYLLSSYAQKKLREWQEKEAKKFFEMTRKKQHFESTERTCNQTILSLSKIVSESILGILKTEDIVQKLQENPENKLELWEQLKIMIFTRICVMVYALCILQVTLRVQLNVIGGYLYRDSVHEEEPLIDSELQAKYLSLCHHFVSRGVEDLAKQIEKAVKRVVESVPLKKKVTIQDIEQMFWSIQTLLCTDSTEGDPVKKMVHYLIGHTEINEAKLDTIVKETMDILESEEVTSVTMSSVSRSFSSVIDEVANLFATKSAPVTKNHLEVEECVVTNGALKLGGSSEPFVDVNKLELHFVMLLPVMNELLTKNTCKGNSNIPDMLTQQLTLNDKFKLLGANIYEVFSNA